MKNVYLKCHRVDSAMSEEDSNSDQGGFIPGILNISLCHQNQ
jgi:hypothetical protein